MFQNIFVIFPPYAKVLLIVVWWGILGMLVSGMICAKVFPSLNLKDLVQESYIDHCPVLKWLVLYWLLSSSIFRFIKNTLVFQWFCVIPWMGNSHWCSPVINKRTLLIFSFQEIKIDDCCSSVVEIIGNCLKFSTRKIVNI